MRVLILAVMLLLSGCGRSQPAVAQEPAAAPGQAEATFAGGCFWCTESDFEKLPGVIAAHSGYSGGRTASPSYEQVSAGDTGHTEVVRVIFDPEKISYAQLLEHFWRDIDPTDAGGQFCDRGSQYRSAIFFHDEAQRVAAEASKQKLQQSGVLKAPVVTEITQLDAFYPAEDYHQDYYKKNPVRYNYYRAGCGRDHRLVEIWGKSP